MDFAAQRRTMVENQIRTFEVSDQALLAAFETVPRELFVAPARRDVAYSDLSTELEAAGERRTLLAPLVLARMLQVARPVRGEAALVVGGGSGYGAALLDMLGATVTLLETPPVAALARAALAAAGSAAVTVVEGDLASTVPDGPFSLIVVEGAFEVEPRGLLDRLSDDGRLIGISRTGRAGRVMLYRTGSGTVSGRSVFDATTPLLPGFAAPRGFVFA